MSKFSFAVALALSLGTEALVPRAHDSCCFHLTASGGVSGEVGQLFDGQNRIHGNYPEGTYCIDDEGAITDGEGRGCILTPPTTQLQCDTGAQPQPGFSVNHEGGLAYNDNTHFWACATGDQGSYNIYTQPVDTICVPITLAADNCKPSGPATTPTSTSSSSTSPSTSPTSSSSTSSSSSSSTSPSSSSSSSSSTSTSSSSSTSTSPSPTPNPPTQPKTCPANLSGPYEFPHLIIPVESSSPDHAAGPTFFPAVKPGVSSIFNFDIPPSDAGKTCTLVFLLPKQSELVTSHFSLSGNGGIDFSQLSGNANEGTTFHNAPSVKTDFGVTKVAPGNQYTITSFDCPAGQRITFKLSASGDTAFDYFQDFNPAPIGLYITKC